MSFHRGKVTGPEWEHVSKESRSGKASWRCLYCDKYFHGSATRIRAHLAGSSSEINVCPKVPKPVQDKLIATSKDKVEDAHAKKRKQALEKLSTENEYKISSQLTLGQVRNKKERSHVDMAIADYIFSDGLPLSTTTKDSFRLMVDSLRAAPPTYSLPSRKAISEDILDKSYDLMQSKIDNLEDDADALQTDGWRDNQRRPLLNVLFGTVAKTFYYMSKETLGISKNADYLEDFICTSIEGFGAQKVYQVNTDNASAVSKARDKVTETYPHIVTGGCTSHSLDLHLEDIGSLSFFKDLLADSKEVVKFVRNHGTILAAYRKSANSTELEMYNEKRFTTEVTMVRSMIKNREYLEEAIVAPAVKEWISHYRQGASGCGTIVIYCIITDWWNKAIKTFQGIGNRSASDQKGYEGWHKRLP